MLKFGIIGILSLAALLLAPNIEITIISGAVLILDVVAWMLVDEEHKNQAN